MNLNIEFLTLKIIQRGSVTCQTPFLNLLHLIKPDPIFYNQYQNPQRDVSIQLAIATCHLGSNVNGVAVLRLKNLFSKLDMEQSTCTLQDSSKQSTIPPIGGNHYDFKKSRYSISLTLVCDVNKKFTSLAIQDHATIAMYSQTCRLLSILKNSLIKISSFWKTQLIQNVDLNYILYSHENHKEMKDTIKWIISCLVLHNPLANLKDHWNELYEEDEPNSAP
ncbi:hypothetical protein VP01_554g4, partial [Puccinia sorghi]